MSTNPRRKQLIIPKRGLILPSARRALPRPAPWIWIPKRFAPKMAVGFDAKNTTVATTGLTASPGTSLASSSVTVSASATLVIGVYASITTNGTLYTPSSANWPTGGAAMTLVSNKTSTDNLANVYVYAIVAPSTGAHTGTVNFSGGSGSVVVDWDCFSFTGTDTSSVANCIPSANVITDATNANTNYPTTAVSVTTVSGDAACGAANSETTSLTGTVAGNGTVINTEGASDANYISAFHLAVGATTTLQFSGAPSGAFPSCGVFFRIQQPVSSFTWLMMDEESNSTAALHKRKVEMVGY